MIAGETGGTGASTTTKIVAQHLDLPTISGGKYFRGLANRFDAFHQQQGCEAMVAYNLFLSLYERIYDTQGLQGVTQAMEEGIRDGANGEVLGKFEHVIEQAKKKNKKNVHQVWDYIVDQQTIQEALSKPGFVWESKLALIATELDQMQAIVPHNNYSSAPQLRVLLSLDPRVAAQRVGQREGRKVNTAEIKLRKKRDFDRYRELYQIHGHPVTPKDLVRFSDIQIDTQLLNAKEVSAQILKGYITKVSKLGQSEQVFAGPAIAEVTYALTQLQNLAV